jgi:hypothetical protein
MSPRPVVSALLLLAFAVACEHPTAPDVQAAAEKSEIQLASGDYSQIEAGLVDLFMLATMYGSNYYGSTNPLVPTAPATIVRSGVEAPFRSTVIERVYLPPEQSGARPVTRFSLIGWSDADSQHLRRLVVMVGGDTVAPVVLPRADSWVSTASRSAFTVTTDQADRRVWYGTEGELRIRAGPRTADCPYEGKAVYVSGMVELQDSTKRRPACETRQYQASMAAFIERRTSGRSSVIDAIRPPIRETLRLVESSVPGVRLVARCTGQFEKDPMPCFDYWSFWRDNDQFDPALGVDLSAMKRDGDDLVQVIDSGTGPDYHEVFGGYDPPYSYRTWSADGKLVSDVARTTIQSVDASSPYNGVREIAFQRLWREGARYRVVTNARKIGHRDASPYSMGVLEVTFLPIR